MFLQGILSTMTHFNCDGSQGCMKKTLILFSDKNQKPNYTYNYTDNIIYNTICKKRRGFCEALGTAR